MKNRKTHIFLCDFNQLKISSQNFMTQHFPVINRAIFHVALPVKRLWFHVVVIVVVVIQKKFFGPHIRCQFIQIDFLFSIAIPFRHTVIGNGNWFTETIPPLRHSGFRLRWIVGRLVFTVLAIWFCRVWRHGNASQSVRRIDNFLEYIPDEMIFCIIGSEFLRWHEEKSVTHFGLSYC